MTRIRHSPEPIIRKLLEAVAKLHHSGIASVKVWCP